MEKECYEEEVQPYRKADYKPIIYHIYIYIVPFHLPENWRWSITLFTSNMIYSRRNDIILNSEINSVTVVIEKREINGHSRL